MSITKLSLFKRYNGIYYITYLQDGIPKWKSTKKKLKHEALKVLSDFQQYLKQDVPKVTFHDFVNHYLSIKSNDLRETTIKRICLPAFVAFDKICGNKLLTAYTLGEVEVFKSKRLEVCSPTTVNIQFRVLRSSFNLAIKWGMLAENPFSKSSQVKAVEQPPIYLTKDEFTRLLRVVKEEVLKEVFLFASLTGMRSGEITNLRWSDIDFHHRQITIKNSDQFQTKTGKNRCVPMNELVVSMLSRKELTQRFCENVFQLQGQRMGQEYLSKSFKRYVRLVGLNDKIHFHSLRHTFATWLVQDGVSIYEVQKLLGHSSVKVTEIYSHLVASELHKSVNKIMLPELN